MKNKNPRVAVIGAGCSGITAIKNLLQAGISNVICFEKNNQIGGNWVYSDQASHSSVCETTHIISSKTMSGFLDFPMPEEYPDYPSHKQVLAYFQSYAKHFGLEPYIRFNTSVEKCEPIENRRWRLTLSEGNEEAFDYVLVANGHHSTPRHPAWAADFSGKYLHSHAYKNNHGFEEEKVLVVGAGNSGCDCAVEISRKAKSVCLSMRSPQYIVPKFFMGKPTDVFNLRLNYMPKFIVPLMQKIGLKIQIGSYADYGLPIPDFPVMKAHPTVNSELLYKLRHGKVLPRKGIDKIEGRKVTFSNGVSEEYDTIVAATGYKISFPFLDKKLVNFEEADQVPLYLRIFHPNIKNLFFIGLVQPQGCVWPLSDAQAKLVANLIAGRWQLPKNMASLAKNEAVQNAKEFLPAKRHSVEVHFFPYLKQLLKLIPKNAPAQLEI